MSDFVLGETLDFKFTTRAFATGVPTVLAGTPAIQIYEDNSVTQITAGITLTVDFDSVVGLNNLRVVATGGNGFETGKSYQAVITTGTVGGVSVVGEVVQQFSIQRAPVNWAKVSNPTTAVDLSGTDIQLVDTTTTNTDMVAAAPTAAAIVNEWETQSQADPTGFHVNVLEVGGTAQTANDNGADINTLLTRIVGTLAAGTHNPASTAQLGALTDWINGGRLDLILDIIAADTTTDIPALIATAQTDLDTITGADGAALASTQQSITFQPIVVTAGDAINNITLAGTGTSDGIAFTRSGAGDPFDTNFIGQINATVDTALTDYDAATGTELAATEAKIDIIDTNVDAVLVDTADMQPRVAAIETDTNELQTDDVPGLIAATEAKIDTIDGIVDNLNLGIIYGAAATGTLSTTQATSDLTGYTDDQLIGRIIIWTSGACEGEGTDITDYASASGLLTFTALTTAPSNTDTFKIV